MLPHCPQPYRSAALDEGQAVLLEVCLPIGHRSLWDNTDICEGIQGRRDPLTKPYRDTGTLRDPGEVSISMRGCHSVGMVTKGHQGPLLSWPAPHQRV